jgi:proline iminopeptidase
MRLLLFLCFAGLAAAQARDGFVDVPGGPVWYRVMGTGRGVPLVVLHGGPGGTSCSYLALDSLGGERRVVLYDQLGSGRSGRPADRRLWTVERFVEELHTVRRRLGLKRMHLMGHSWGATLAAAYVAAKGTRGIESLILASPLIKTADWIRDADELRKELPAEAQAALRRHEAAGTTDSAEYREAEEEFTRRFVRRSGPRRRDAACAGSVGNSVIYEQMWGPSEFHATGSLKEFDLTSRLGMLRLPVLFVTGEFDEARPETVAGYARRVRGARMEVVPGAAHALLQDAEERTKAVIGEFLRGVERRQPASSSK